MRLSIVFLGVLALAAAIPSSPKVRGAGQDLLKKQQDVIVLLENIAGSLPNQQYWQWGQQWDFLAHLQQYENPSVVKYYWALYQAGQVQPQNTPFSVSVSQLRKEVALLTQIFMGAQDYETFLHTACWARVHVNQDQFVKAFSSAVIQRQDMQGVILPPAYEVFPHYFFDTQIIQKVQNYVNQHVLDNFNENAANPEQNVHYIYVNYTSYLPYGENEISYFTEDIGLSAYYAYVNLASFMLPNGGQYYQKNYAQEGQHQGKNGHGAHYYYLHQQLLARYNLERLGQGLGPIPELDYYYEHIETPFKPNMRYLNGVNFPGRDEHTYITPKHHNYDLLKLIRALEQRIVDAIDSGHVITPQGAFLSLYQPNGLNILGELIEGSGHSINPRYYGAFQYVAKQLLGGAPEFNNIWEYCPSALELAQTSVKDPMFYQLYSKILSFFQYYQDALPAYQYNDVVVPGVKIENVDVSELVTYFSDYQVALDNAVVQPVSNNQQHSQQPFPKVMAHLKRLDHKPYQYTVQVNAEKPVTGAVVHVYVGPKYNYDGQPIDISQHRQYFFELDQFVYDISVGQNVIVRNSQQATGQSFDWPSVQQIKESIAGAMNSQNPHYVVEPQQLYGFPARLALPKGSQNGFPLQMLVVITAGVNHQSEHYGPVVDEEWMTYQPQHFQVVEPEDYQKFNRLPIDKVNGAYQSVEVVPEVEGLVIPEGNWHWGYLYKNYPGMYYYPQQYNMQGQGAPQGYVAGQYNPQQQQQINQQQQFNQQQQQQQPQQQQQQQQQYLESIVEGINSPFKSIVPKIKGFMSNQQQGQANNQQNVNQYGQVGQQYSSGQYPVVQPYQNKGWQGHEQYVQQYYQNKYIGDIIGGAISLDNKPFGFPLDRPLAVSAFNAPNIYVKEVAVYHQDQWNAQPVQNVQQ